MSYVDSIYASISEILPNKWRAFGIATTEINLSILGTFGPMIGRGLTKTATWRWIFILGEATGVIATVGTVLFYHPPGRIFRNRSKRQILYELDYVGIFLYSAGVSLFLFGLGLPGNGHPWRSPAVIALLATGVVLFLATFAWDLSGHTARPLFPARLLRRFREFGTLLIINFSSGLAHISLGNFIPQQISMVFTFDPITAGWYNIPAGVGTIFGGVVLGSLAPRIKHIPLQLVVANAVQAAGCGLLAIVTPNRIAGGLVIQAIAALPFAWILVLCYTTAGLHVPQRDIGLSYGLLGAARYLGGAIGTTMCTTILQGRVSSIIPKKVAEAVIPLGFPAAHIGTLVAALSSGNSAMLAAFPQDVVMAAREALRWGYSDALTYVWYVSIPFFIIACVVSIFVLDPSPYFTNHTAVVTSGKRVVRPNPIHRRKTEEV